MASWVIRATSQHIPQRSPRAMEKQFGGSFVDGAGNAVTNVLAAYNPDLAAVTGFATKYWIVQAFPDDTITLMGSAARDVVDAAEASAERDKTADQINEEHSWERGTAESMVDIANDLQAQINELKAAIRNANNVQQIQDNLSETNIPSPPSTDRAALHANTRAHLDDTGTI